MIGMFTIKLVTVGCNIKVYTFDNTKIIPQYTFDVVINNVKYLQIVKKVD